MCTGDYEQHIESMMGVDGNKKMPTKEIDLVLDNLIKCIPNGKLYKFRRIKEDDEFDHVRKSLKYSYLWLSRADQFKDKTDSIIRFDVKKDSEELRQTLKNSPRLAFSAAMRALSQGALEIKPTFDRTMINWLPRYFDERTGKIDVKAATKFFRHYGVIGKDASEALKALQYITDNQIYKNDDFINQYADRLVNFNQMNRQIAYVCSLCDNYKNKSMWDNYADEGICIEYNYNKLRHMPYEMRREFCDTFKVEYTDEPKIQSFMPYYLKMLKCEEIDYKDANTIKEINRSVLVKSTDYIKENEWRIFYYHFHNNDNGLMMTANIVSTIIFDEKAISTEHGKRILSLCKERNWTIKVRILNEIGTDYNFIPYEEYVKRGEKDV